MRRGRRAYSAYGCYTFREDPSSWCSRSLWTSCFGFGYRASDLGRGHSRRASEGCAWLRSWRRALLLCGRSISWGVTFFFRLRRPSRRGCTFCVSVIPDDRVLYVLHLDLFPRPGPYGSVVHFLSYLLDLFFPSLSSPYAGSFRLGLDLWFCSAYGFTISFLVRVAPGLRFKKR